MLIWLVQIQQVFAFGCNSSGQLGLGDFQDRRAPCEVPGLWALPVVSLSAGDEHSTALTANGFLFAWGGNDRGQLGLPKNADAAERVWATPISLHVSEDSCFLHGQLNVCGAHVGAGGVSQEVLCVWCPGARVPCTKGLSFCPTQACKQGREVIPLGVGWRAWSDRGECGCAGAADGERAAEGAAEGEPALSERHAGHGHPLREG